MSLPNIYNFIILDIDDSEIEAVQSNIRTLENTLSDLAVSLMAELREKGIPAESVIDWCSNAPRSMNREGVIDALGKKELKENKTLSSLFRFLGTQVWNFIDYHLLEFIISRLGSESLQQRMKDYVSRLQGFRRSTSMSSFIQSWSGRFQKPEDYDEVTATFNTDCTIELVDQFRRQLQEKLLLLPPLSKFCAMLYYKHKNGGFMVTSLPPEVENQLETDSGDIVTSLPPEVENQLETDSGDIVTSLPPDVKNHLETDSGDIVHSIDTLSFTKAGMRYRNEPMGVTIDVPEGAIKEGFLDIKVGLALYGPFSYPDGLRPVSVVLLMCPQQEVTLLKPIRVILPHIIDCAQDSDYSNCGLTPLKACHDNYDDVKKMNRFEAFDVEDLKVFKHKSFNYSSFHIDHFCYVCLAAGTRPLNISYCLSRINPQVFPLNRVSTMCFCVCFCMKACLEVSINCNLYNNNVLYIFSAEAE